MSDLELPLPPIAVALREPPPAPPASARLRSVSGERRSRSRSEAGAEALAAAASPVPRPLSRGRSRRSLRRFINEQFISAPWAVRLWSGLSDEELAHRLRHVLVAPPGSVFARPNAGLHALVAPGNEAVRDEFRRGGFVSDARALLPGGHAANAGAPATATAMLQRMWLRVPQHARPQLLRECRRAQRVAAAAAGAAAPTFLDGAEALCAAAVAGQLLPRLRAAAPAGGAGSAAENDAYDADDGAADSFASLFGEEFAAALARPMRVGTVEVELAGAAGAADAVASVECVEVCVFDGSCASLLSAAAAFYGLRAQVRRTGAAGAASDGAAVGGGAAAAPVYTVRVFVPPARSQAARRERAATAQLCRQLADAARLAAEEDAEAAAAAAAAAARDAKGEAAAGLLPPSTAPAPALAAPAAASPAADPLSTYGAVPPLISLHVRTIGDVTRASFSASLAARATGPLPRSATAGYHFGRIYRGVGSMSDASSVAGASDAESDPR